MSQGEDRASEVEATLAVSSQTPREVVEELRSLTRAGPFPLRWRGSAELRDVYFDSGASGLRERGLALRLRRGDAGWSLTLKGEARRAPAGALERTELERDWSEEGLVRVVEELERRGAGPKRRPRWSPGADPPEVLRSAGFRVVQDRRTVRRRAAVLPAGGGGGPAGELALDTVRFRVPPGRTVRHREVEIEAAPGAPGGLPGRVAAELRSRFGGELRPWEHSKLATGTAVAAADPPVGAGGELLPADYDRLEERLGRPGRSG